MIERGKTCGRLLVDVVLYCTAFLSMLLVFVLFCVVGLVLPACVSVQFGCCFSPPLLFLSFLQYERTKLSSLSQTTTTLFFLTCFFTWSRELLWPLHYCTAMFRWGCAQDRGLEPRSYDYMEGGLCLETTQQLFAAADLHLHWQASSR